MKNFLNAVVVTASVVAAVTLLGLVFGAPRAYCVAGYIYVTTSIGGHTQLKNQFGNTVPCRETP